MSGLSKDKRDAHILKMVERMAEILLEDGKPAHVALSIGVLISYFIGGYPKKKQEEIAEIIRNTALQNVAHLDKFAMEISTLDGQKPDDKRAALYKKFGMIIN
jgi:hypothetical protein